MELRVSRPVAAPPESVWGVITDLAATPEVLSGVEKVERLDEGDGFDVGTRWRETRRMFGKEATEEMEVSSVEPGSAYTTTAEQGTTTYTSTLRVDPADGDRCRLTMTFAAESSSPVGRLLAATVGRAFQSATRRMLQRDLDDIAEVVESRPQP